MAAEEIPSSTSTTTRTPESRLRDIALEGFREGVKKQREARRARGFPPISSVDGFQSLGASLRGFIEAIPFDDAYAQATFPAEPPDGGPLCATCDAARWLRRQNREPISTQLVRCPTCLDATRLPRLDALAGAAGLSSAQREKTFAAWQYMPGAEAAASAAAEWATTWAVAPEPGDTPWLVLSGARGSGKTHLSLAAANALIHALQPVAWWQTVDLVDEARARMADGAGAALAFRRGLEQPAPLILDEFGALSTMGTNWAVSGFIEPLLDARYRSAAPTLFTMKNGPREVREHTSDSVGRRMQDPDVCTWVENSSGQFPGGRAA